MRLVRASSVALAGGLLVACGEQARGGPPIDSERFHGRLVNINGRTIENSAVWATLTSENLHVDLDGNCDHHYANLDPATDKRSLTTKDFYSSVCPETDRADLAEVVTIMKSRPAIALQGEDNLVMRTPAGQQVRFEVNYNGPFIE